MNLNHDDDKSIRKYLLGELAPEAAKPLEERLLGDENFAEQVLLVEDEMIEDYARGALGSDGRASSVAAGLVREMR